MTEKLAPAYLIIGDDAFLVEEARDEIVSQVGELGVDEFGADDDAAPILQALGTAPMFGDTRVVVIRDLEQFGAEFQRNLVEYLEDPSSSVVLILTSAKAIPKVAAAVRKVGRQIDASKGRRGDLLTWLREQGRKRGMKLSGDTLTALVDSVGEDRMALSQAIEEVGLAVASGAPVTPQDITRQFHGRADARIFGFIDAVAGRQTGTALDLMHRLLRQGEAPQAIFWMLTRHFRMLLAVGDLPSRKVSETLNLPAWRAEKLTRQSTNFTESELARAYGALADADRKMKRSEEPEELTLERAVVSIATGIGGATPPHPPLRRRT